MASRSRQMAGLSPTMPVPSAAPEACHSTRVPRGGAGSRDRQLGAAQVAQADAPLGRADLHLVPRQPGHAQWLGGLVDPGALAHERHARRARDTAPAPQDPGRRVQVRDLSDALGLVGTPRDHEHGARWVSATSEAVPRLEGGLGLGLHGQMVQTQDAAWARA